MVRLRRIAFSLFLLVAFVNTPRHQFYVLSEFTFSMLMNFRFVFVNKGLCLEWHVKNLVPLQITFEIC